MIQTIYLAGEIHTNWRDSIISGARSAGLDIEFTSPVLDHSASDDCGPAILGPQPDPFWHDHTSAKINAIRTRTAIETADLVIVRFGDQYKQWNAAFDAGQAVANGVPLVVIHSPEHRHALKEIDAAALAVAETAEQVVELLRYVVKGELVGVKP